MQEVQGSTASEATLRVRSTSESPQAGARVQVTRSGLPEAGDVLGRVMYGTIPDALNSEEGIWGASIVAVATDNWAETSHPTRLEFRVAGPNQAEPVTVAVLGPNGFEPI